MKKKFLPDDKQLTLKPGPFKTTADLKLIENVERILKQIYDLLPGEKVLVTDRDFFLYWEYQYNPDKGETARGEMKRWAEHLYHSKKISAFFETGSDIEERMVFQNDLTTQLDAFMFLKQKFHESYGFAEKPFAFLANHKDAWALRLQIMERYPIQTKQFIIEGIKIIESQDINEGEYLFVRK